MKFLQTLVPSLLLAGAGFAHAASSWSFDAATVSTSSKGGADSKAKLSLKAPLSESVVLAAGESVKVLLTATEDGKAKRPHQGFLLLRDIITGLEATFPLSLKESGKGKVDIAQKDLPLQLLHSTQPLEATLLLASFGSSTPLKSHLFNIDVQKDPNAPIQAYEKPERYGKLPAIDHVFKADAKSPPKIISLFFVLAILGTVPVLFGAWLYLEANLNQFSKAFSTAPISHALFFGSILSMEAIFFGYYTTLNLFQTLPLAGIVGLVGFITGSKALSEVQSRRLAGER